MANSEARTQTRPNLTTVDVEFNKLNHEVNAAFIVLVSCRFQINSRQPLRNRFWLLYVMPIDGKLEVKRQVRSHLLWAIIGLSRALRCHAQCDVEYVASITK